jgi:hypothetical protein
MITIRWKVLALDERAASLCVTCTWGLVRRGFKTGEEETFCRLINPNGFVAFAVSDCSGYTDRRVAEAGTSRRMGFVPIDLAEPPVEASREGSAEVTTK